MWHIDSSPLGSDSKMCHCLRQKTPCPTSRGNFGWDFIYHPNRVLKPLIRKELQRAGHRTQASGVVFIPFHFAEAAAAA